MRDLREGDAIGQYVLERAIDRGSFGRVWRGRDTATGRIVAIKVLASNSADEEHARARSDLERLAAAAARDSRHIVRVLGGGHDPVPHIVMEFVDGTNLREELSAHGAIPQDEVIRIGLQIADALSALHRVRIVHRDVKPANILLDEKGEVRLTDFGIAKILGYDETVTLTQQNLLSAPYAAPEVWEGAPNPSSDLYAFGAVLFEMLAGRPPFQGDLMNLFRQHRTDEVDLGLLPAHTAPSLRELVYQCLRKEPPERPPTAEACFRFLERAREELRPEPEQFGPWLRVEPHPEQAWAWRCVHERTGEAAVVEVHFAQDEAYGDSLRAALNLNPKLVPLGAEKLLGSNRLLLKDNEGWPSAPDHNLVFWVARQDTPPPAPAEELGREALQTATEGLLRLIEVAANSGVRLSIDAGNAVVREDGGVWLMRPGLPPAARVEPRLGAFILLRSQPLAPEAAEIAARARDIRDLRERLGRPPGSPGSSSEASRGRTLILLPGLAGIALAVAVALFVLLRPSGDSSQVILPPAEETAVASCSSVKLPASFADVRTACGPGSATRIELSPDCARGQVCRLETRGGVIILHGNDLSIAFVDSSGDLVLARESDFTATRLLSDGRIREPAWSPDGRYLAYIIGRTAAEGEVTELWVLDTKEPAGAAMLLTSTEGPAVPEWRRRRITQPRWSPDSRVLYFLWRPASGRSEVWSIELPQRNDALDTRELRTWNGSPKNLRTSSIEAIDGVTPLRIESMTPLAGGAVLVEFCATRDGACGLARWDEAGVTTIAAAALGARFIAPIQSGDNYLALTLDGSDAILVEVGAGGVIRPIARMSAGVGPTPPSALDLSLTLAPERDRALVGTPAGLKLITIANGEVRPLVDGRWATWLSPAQSAVVAAPPAATPFATPGLTPSPPPAATAPPGGETDLTGEVVASTCVIGQVLSIKIRNLGPLTVDRDIFIRVATIDGTTRQGSTNVGQIGLRPGQEVEIKTTYTVREQVQVIIDSVRDRRTENNIVTCNPRPS